MGAAGFGLRWAWISGWAAVTRASSGAVAIWRKPLADGSYALAVFNRSNAPVSHMLSFTALGQAAPAALIDLWSGQTLTVEGATMALPIAAHGVRFFRVRPRA